MCLSLLPALTRASSSTTRCDLSFLSPLTCAPYADCLRYFTCIRQWFDAKNSTPRFPFGFGLSYSSFEYSNASVSSTPTNDSGYVQLTAEPFDGERSLYDMLYTVTVTVENTGDVTAAEVAQLVSPLSFRFALLQPSLTSPLADALAVPHLAYFRDRPTHP